jgi:hypothetical protein
VGGKPRRPARELGPLAEERDELVMVRLTATERAVFAGAASRTGHTMSGWLRQAGRTVAEGRARLLAVDIRRELDVLIAATVAHPGRDREAHEAIGALELAIFELRGGG